MKALWNAVCILALANLMAIAGVALWLFSSGRLDKDRLTHLREMLSTTVAQEQADAQKAVDEQHAAEAEAAREERETRAPLSAAEQLHVRLDLSEVDHQRIERLRQETQDLTRTVSRDQERLAEERAAFEAERDAFDQMRAQLASVEGSAQFRKAVGTLQGLKPADAVAILMEILRAPAGLAGSAPAPGAAPIDFESGGADQVVSYLNAMQERARNKVMAEFTSADPALAADLLERLRTRGLRTEAMAAPRSQTPP